MTTMLSPEVSKQNIISVGKFDEFCWIRCESKGNFQNSPLVKQWLETQLAAGSKFAVADLENCSGMDSTFMGNLAGLAMKLSAAGGGLQIADASEKCVGLLEDLGLAGLMEINPEAAVWQREKDSIRQRLVTLEGALQEEDRTTHVYETHQKLCEADSENLTKFSAVLECLEAEMANKKQ